MRTQLNVSFILYVIRLPLKFDCVCDWDYGFRFLPSLTHFPYVPRKKIVVNGWSGESRKPTTKRNQPSRTRRNQLKEQETYQLKQSLEWKFNECHVTCNEYNRFIFLHSFDWRTVAKFALPSIVDVGVCRLATNISLCVFQIYPFVSVMCATFQIFYFFQLDRIPTISNICRCQNHSIRHLFSYTIAMKKIALPLAMALM